MSWSQGAARATARDAQTDRSRMSVGQRVVSHGTSLLGKKLLTILNTAFGEGLRASPTMVWKRAERVLRERTWVLAMGPGTAAIFDSVRTIHRCGELASVRVLDIAKCSGVEFAG